MRVKRSSKKDVKYEYDYKPVFLTLDVHSQLKEMAQNEKLTFNKLIHKLINQKTCQCPNGENQNTIG